MSTGASDKRAVLATVALAVVLIGAAHTALDGFAGWAEKNTDTYPYRDQDYLRYLVPTLHEGRGANRILLAGPSEGREAFLYESFDDAFPRMKAYQGAQSLGTFHDLLLALELIAGSYGADAVPKVLVLGVSPRFVANVPSRGSPLVTAIDSYSPDFTVKSSAEGPRLREKSFPKGVLARIRFLERRQGRYRAALCALALTLAGEPVRREHEPGWPAVVVSGADTKRLVAERGMFGAAFEIMRIFVSPYRYHHLRPMEMEGMRGWMEDPGSFWYAMHRWEPAEGEDMIRAEFAHLRDLAERFGIDVYVVNLPEHPMNQEGYAPGRYEQYLEFVKREVPEDRFLDLRDLLDADEFYDVGHAIPAGAVRITDRVIEFMRAAGFRGE